MYPQSYLLSQLLQSAWNGRPKVVCLGPITNIAHTWMFNRRYDGRSSMAQSKLDNVFQCIRLAMIRSERCQGCFFSWPDGRMDNIQHRKPRSFHENHMDVSSKNNMPIGTNTPDVHRACAGPGSYVFCHCPRVLLGEETNVLHGQPE
jgi:hypothetical protein